MSCGYIDIPDPCGTSVWKSYLGYREFAALSRSTIDADFEPPPDRLENQRRRLLDDVSVDRAYSMPVASMEYGLSSQASINETGWFDEDVYDRGRPWCMFNVLLLMHENGIAYRSAIGRIHVDAFLSQGAEYETIELE
jgi:hypothetical protein